jgi:tetratricopeptide (TPR) repeat protein
MKSWFASSLLVVAVLAAWAAPAEGLKCLESYDLICAQEEAQGTSKEAKLLQARLQFYQGQFEEALKGMEALQSSFTQDEGFNRELELYRRTKEATTGFTSYTLGSTSEAIVVRYQPGLDRVMVEEAAEVLEKARSNIGVLLGGAPPGGIRMELYPTIPRFTDASSLPASAVRTTGVVALSKWTRLLVTSPRALGRGYAWKDTLSHEYTHYIVAWRTGDKAPVWLQEGIARAVEHRWRAGGTPELTPFTQSLLAEALAQDSFIPLEKMHPSIAFLDSARDAALAYAQVCTMILYLQSVAGEDSISKVLDRARDGVDAIQAVADVGSSGDIDAFMTGWKGYLKGLGLVARKLQELPTQGGTSAYDLDPILAKRRDLAGFARLGDLLSARGHYEAALVEYQKAISPEEGPSPILVARMSESLLKLGRATEAGALLEASIRDYPEVAATQAALGRLMLAEGNRTEALKRFRASLDIDPFDAELQGQLADLYGALGQTALAERHAGYRRILESGGLNQDTSTQ